MNYERKYDSKPRDPAGFKRPVGNRGDEKREGAKPIKSIIQEDTEVWTKRPPLVFNKGALSNIHIPYTLGPEANKSLRKYFSYLIDNETPDRPRFVNQSRQVHPHPVGGFIRAYMGDLIPLKYAPDGLILDIGTSQVRLASRYDTDGQPLCHRVHSMAPVLSGRDILREMANKPRVYGSSLKPKTDFINGCRCEGGQWKSRCHVCTSDMFDTTMSVDSVYYPGVLEEILSHGTHGALGYVVFNDYDKARIMNGNQGVALDRESHYVIEGDQVSSYVNGNPAPYQHGFLRTGGHDTWQYRFFFRGKIYYMVFETVEEFQNGDIPYKMCRVYVVDHLRIIAANPLESMGVKGIPLFTSHFFSSEERLEPKQVTKVVEVSKDTIGLRLSERPGCRRSQGGDVLIDLTARDERTKSDLAIWEAFVDQYEFYVHSRSERFFTTLEEVDGSKVQMINMEMLSTKWYTLGLATASTSVRARLEHVVEAYLAIGNKKLNSSVKQACIQVQRNLGLGAKSLDLTEAFLIARVMRAQEEVRFDDVLNLSKAVNRAAQLK